MFNLFRPLLGASSAGIGLARNIMAEQVRFNSKWFFEKCSEIKRIRKHGYKKRVATPKGRVILMRRILKGRHILAH